MSRFKLFVIVSVVGAVLLAACGTPQGDAQANPDGSVNVEVTLTDFAIESSVTEFKTGVKYHFIVANTGQVAHEFMILPVSEHMGMGASMEEMDEMALMMISAEQLPVGATVESDYSFSEVPNEKIELVCMTPGHYEAGMKLAVEVQ